MIIHAQVNSNPGLLNAMINYLNVLKLKKHKLRQLLLGTQIIKRVSYRQVLTKLP